MKGANLAMEQVDAEQHGWVQAPYPTKADTDASYKRLLDSCLRPEWAGAIRLGVASHNLFDLAWALTLRDELPASRRADIDIEMLEGMVPAQARAVQQTRRHVAAVLPDRPRRRDRGEPRLSRPPFRREHGAGELPAGDVRDAPRLARVRRRRPSASGSAVAARRDVSTQRLRRPIDVRDLPTPTARVRQPPGHRLHRRATGEPTSPRPSPSTPSTAAPTGSTR